MNEVKETDEIKRGDVVHLNSQPGLKMTVDGDAATSGCVICVWFNGAELRSGQFDKLSLTKTLVKSGVNFG